MSTTVVSPDCVCGSIGRTDLRQCPVDHRLWNGDKRLVSVGRIVGLIPQEPCNVCGAQSYRDHAAGCPVYEKILNAQIRGKQCDELFSQYVIGKLTYIPIGTRWDVYDEVSGSGLLQKLMRWFDKQHFTSVESQVVVGDDEVGGVLDLRFDGMILDLKCTYEVSDAHVLQVAGYASLDENCDDYGILHAAERFPEPRLTRYGGDEVDDFEVLRKAYMVIKRRTGKDA